MSARVASILLAIPLSGCLCAMTGGSKGTSEPVKSTDGDSNRAAEGDHQAQEARVDSKRQSKDRSNKIDAQTKSCGLTVVAKSPGAVGDPCLTTTAFMRSEGLSEQAMAQVEKIVTALKKRGGGPLAH